MNEIQTIEIKRFNYEQLDATTASFLINTENIMRETLGNAYTKIGQELKNSQDLLSKNGYGCFEEWYTSLGFKKNKVYDLINRYDLIVGNSDKQNMIEELPLSLSYEISKPSADEELKKMVLDGDIATLKELNQIKKDKKELEQKIQDLENRPVKTVVLEKEVPVVPEDYQYYKDKSNERGTLLKQAEDKVRELNREVQDKAMELEKATNEKSILERKAKLNEEESKKYNQLKDQIENLSKQKDDLGRQIKSRTELSGLVVRVEHMLKTELAPIKYSRAIRESSTDEIVTRNLRDIVNRVEDWCKEMYQYVGHDNIINVEVIDYE